MRYRAILLDADDTIFDFRACERNAITALARHIGLADPDAPAVYSEINRACWVEYERGLITQQRLSVRRFEAFLAHYAMTWLDPAIMADHYERALSHQAVMIEGAEQVVREIAAHRPIAMVTNGIARCQRGRLEISPVKPFFQTVVISGECGCAKPDPRMIEIALGLLGNIPKADVLMVGDSLHSDIRCALNAGVDACWYNPRGEEHPADMDIRHTISDIRQLVPIALQ